MAHYAVTATWELPPGAKEDSAVLERLETAVSAAVSSTMAGIEKPVKVSAITSKRLSEDES